MFVVLLAVSTVVAIGCVLFGGIFVYAYLERLRFQHRAIWEKQMFAFSLLFVAIGGLFYSVFDKPLGETGVRISLGDIGLVMMPSFGFFGLIFGLLILGRRFFGYLSDHELVSK